MEIQTNLKGNDSGMRATFAAKNRSETRILKTRKKTGKAQNALANFTARRIPTIKTRNLVSIPFFHVVDSVD